MIDIYPPRGLWQPVEDDGADRDEGGDGEHLPVPVAEPVHQPCTVHSTVHSTQYTRPAGYILVLKKVPSEGS